MWAKIGNRQVYRVPIYAGETLCEHLAVIRKKNDGRWDWWQKTSRYHKGWREQQGVANTEQEAKEKATTLDIAAEVV